MAKSIIVYGVKGGKTRFAQRIAGHFGLVKIFSFEKMHFSEPDDVLYLSSSTNGSHLHIPSRSFQSVADEINAAIPLTDWQSGPPPMVGEWNASAYRFDNTRRWWDGKGWSMNYGKNISDEYRNKTAKMKISPLDKVRKIEWRGLSSEPIKVTE